MRCERLSATLPTSVCISKQAEVERYVKTRKKTANGLKYDEPNIPAHSCYNCAQGAKIKKTGGDDMDVEEIKALVAQGKAPALRRICSKCRQEKELSYFYRDNSVCRPCTVAIAKAKLKVPPEPRPTKYREDAGPEPAAPVDKSPPRSIFIEISGQRIELCRECARKYLKM